MIFFGKYYFGGPLSRQEKVWLVKNVTLKKWFPGKTETKIRQIFRGVEMPPSKNAFVEYRMNCLKKSPEVSWIVPESGVFKRVLMC